MSDTTSISKRKVILDVDTGSDDAVAIIAALLSKNLKVVGICTVAGNKPLPNTTENTLRVIDLMGSKVPVYRGCAQPMVKLLDPYRSQLPMPEPLYDEEGKPVMIHQDYLPLPEAVSQPKPINAVTWLVDTLSKTTEKLTIIGVGPLTNIAMAIRTEPSIVENIEEILIMGGGHLMSNQTSAAEFNIWYDPEAAQIVLTCGAKITLVPLDATYDASLCLDDAKELRTLGKKTADFVAEMIEHRVAAYSKIRPMGREDITPLHDALVVCAAIDPTVLQDVRFMRVDVDCSGGVADGQTVCDTRARNQLPKNCHVALKGDSRKFFDMLYKLLKSSPV